MHKKVILEAFTTKPRLKCGLFLQSTLEADRL